MSNVEIAVLELGGVPAVSLGGELDMAAEDEVRWALQELERTTPAVMLVDLSRLEFIDSTGLRVLVEAHQRARREGRTMALLAGPQRVHMVFCMTGLDKHLEFINLCDVLEEDVSLE